MAETPINRMCIEGDAAGNFFLSEEVGGEGMAPIWQCSAVTCGPEARADAAKRMVLAFNCHADLVEALKDCIERFVTAFPAAEEYEPIKRARTALSRAEGRE